MNPRDSELGAGDGGGRVAGKDDVLGPLTLRVWVHALGTQGAEGGLFPASSG